MWDLSSGRKAFLGRNGGTNDRSFWWHVLKRQGAVEALADPAAQPALIWKPNISNCPELELEVVAFLDDLDPELRDFLSTIFVGRTYSGALNAEARQDKGSAWVAISLQYTSAVTAYITAYDRFVALAMQRQGGAAVLDSEIDELFAQIAVSRGSWADETKFAGAHRMLLAGPHGRDAQTYERLLLDAEMFVVGHEYAHHLLGHTSRSAKRFKADSAVADLFESLKLNSFIYDRIDSQTRELLADVVGVCLAGTSRGRGSPDAEYRTIISSICALLAEADVKDNWFLPADDEYPSTIDRVSLLLSIMPKLFSTAPTKGKGDSVGGLTRHLAAFATACLQSSLFDRKPLLYSRPTWTQVVSALATGHVVLKTTVENKDWVTKYPGWVPM